MNINWREIPSVTHGGKPTFLYARVDFLNKIYHLSVCWRRNWGLYEGKINLNGKELACYGVLRKEVQKNITKTFKKVCNCS